MSEKRFIVINKAGDSWVRDTQTGLEYWDFFHSVEDANSFADTFNAAKYPDLVLKLRGSVLDMVIDDTLSEFAAPLEQRIAELEAMLENAKDVVSYQMSRFDRSNLHKKISKTLETT